MGAVWAWGGLGGGMSGGDCLLPISNCLLEERGMWDKPRRAEAGSEGIKKSESLYYIRRKHTLLGGLICASV